MNYDDEEYTQVEWIKTCGVWKLIHCVDGRITESYLEVWGNLLKIKS